VVVVDEAALVDAVHLAGVAVPAVVAVAAG